MRCVCAYLLVCVLCVHAFKMDARDRDIGRSLTSVIDTAGGGATGGWPSVFGSRSGGRPRPPATPRCQPMGGG